MKNGALKEAVDRENRRDDKSPESRYGRFPARSATFFLFLRCRPLDGRSSKWSAGKESAKQRTINTH